MKRLLWQILFFSLLVSSSFAQSLAFNTIRVGNADNRVELTAGHTAPRLIRLVHSDGGDWQGNGSEALIGSATLHGKSVPLHWRYDAKASRFKRDSATLAYTTSVPDLRLLWQWHARAAHGPIEHTIRIENRGKRDVWIPLQDSFDFHWKIDAHEPLQQLWIDKGISEPPLIGTHSVDVPDGYAWHGESSTFAQQHKGPAREMIPYFMLRRTGTQAGAWYVGVEFSGRIAMTLQRHADALTGTVGLNPEPGPFRTRIAAGESFVAPTVFVGASAGDVDDTGNALRRWVRKTLNNPATLRNPDYPLVTNNSWGSAMAISGAQARRMIDDAKSLGFEMFHLDAGWFRAVGDWFADRIKFPHGIAALSAYAHKRGLRFGLWVDWAASRNQHARRRAECRRSAPRATGSRPIRRPAGNPPIQGHTIDLGVPAAQAMGHARGQSHRARLSVDMLEHDGYVVAQGCDRNDHPHAPIDPANTRRYTDDEFLRVDSSNSTDVSVHATRAYYAIQSGAQARHIRACCWKSATTAGAWSISAVPRMEIISPSSIPTIRYPTARHSSMPVMYCHRRCWRTYVKSVPTPRIENFRYMLRSGMMGWVSVMIDTNAWTHEQHVAAAREIAFYKSTLRPLIRSADLYHVSPRPDGKAWDGMEYFDARRGTGVLYAFHGSDAMPKSHAFRLKGLDADAHYTLHFRDGSSPDRNASGSALMQSGIEVSLPLADSSELVQIDAVKL